MNSNTNALSLQGISLQQWFETQPKAALNWLKDQAENGMTEAQFVYAQYLLQGLKTTAQPQEAVKWFKRAAQANHAFAMNMVGRCYELGWGVTIDFTISSYWYQLSAQAQCVWGMYNYATALALGRGITENKTNAFKWFLHAGAQGHAKSLNYLGSFYEDGWVVHQNLTIAQQYYQRAAYRGDFRAQFNLARLLAQQEHESKAQFWLEKSLKNANPDFIQKIFDFCQRSSCHFFQAFLQTHLSYQKKRQFHHAISYKVRINT